ncbi:MAG: IPT/TIG domain-containing protein, partial [Actinomycetota bacterium]|nr:IPT/TIG domain-containing protein [Actinomycetota bacterium]
MPLRLLKPFVRLLLLAAVAVFAHTASAGAAISYVASSTATRSWAFVAPGTATIARPTGVVAGDVLILTVQASGSNFYSTSDPTSQSPAWTLVRADGNMATYRIVVPAGNPASYTITSWFFGEIGSITAVASAFRGVSATTPVTAHASGTGSGTAVTLPSAAVSSAGSMRYSAVSTASTPTTTYGSLTLITNYRPGDSVAPAYDSTPESPPTAPTSAATLSASTAWGAHTLILKPTPTTPTVTSLSPGAGPTTGGTSVVITGTDFTGATAVRFGATNASSFTVDNDGQITATAPAGTGTQDVTVTTPLGTSTNTAADDYTYYAPPTVTSLSPTAGPTAGGTSVTIT